MWVVGGIGKSMSGLWVWTFEIYISKIWKKRCPRIVYFIQLPKNIKKKTKNWLATKKKGQTDINAKYCKTIFYKTTTPIPNISCKQAVRKIKNHISSGNDVIHRVYNSYVEYIESSFIFVRYVKH